MSDDSAWQKREEEYLRLLREADERYWRLVEEHKNDKRQLNYVWIGWIVILLLGFYFERNFI